MIAMLVRTTLLMAMALTMLAAAPSAPSVARNSDSPNDLINAAARALRSGELDQAISLYERAQQVLPDRPEIPYNLGVARYRKGEFDKAAEAFQKAITLSDDGPLRTRAIYNMGNAAYAQSQSIDSQLQVPNQLNQATKLLKDALDHYKKAIDADPTDEDARANAELSHHLLKQLQQMQQQQQQQQQNSDQQQDPQDQQQQQSGEQQQSDEQSDQQQQQSSSDQQQQQSQQQSQDESADQPQTQEQAAQVDAEENDQPPPPQEDQGEHVQHQPQQPRSEKMTRDEAERLLQSVRDKERKRRAELARRENIKHPPVEKDW